MEANESEYYLENNPMRHRILTIPNVICFVRLLGALTLIYFAVANMTLIFVTLISIVIFIDF